MHVPRSLGASSLGLGLLVSLMLLLSSALIADAAPLVPEVSQTNARGPVDAWLGVAGALGALALLVGIAVGFTRASGGPDPGRGRSPEDRAPPGADPGSTEAPAGFDGVLRLGQQAVAAGNYEDAATWFQTAVDLRPERQVGHLCLGLCLEELGEHEQALAHLTEAATLDPEDGLPRYARARVLVQVRRPVDAISALAPLVQADEEVAKVAAEDPAFRELHDHPRFLAVLGRL